MSSAAIGLVGVFIVSCMFCCTQSSLGTFVWYAREHPDFFRKPEEEAADDANDEAEGEPEE